MEIKVSKKLHTEITNYCILNNIDNVEVFIERLLKIGFDIEKWGEINSIPEKEIQKPTVDTNKGKKLNQVVGKIKSKPVEKQHNNDIYDE